MITVVYKWCRIGRLGIWGSRKVLLLMVCFPALALSQDFVEPSGILVHVRTVKASGMTSQAVRENHTHLSIDKQIEDLRDKLENLHYSRYRLISSQRKVIPVKRKETMLVAGGNTLTLRPIYMDQQRMGMSLKWVDKGGTQLLDTRMHFNWGEEMITGTDSDDDCGLILAISVSPTDKDSVE